MLAATGSALLRERALDIRDVCRALLREVYGDALPADEIVLDADSVCVAETLTPGQFLALDRERRQGPGPGARRNDVAHGDPGAVAAGSRPWSASTASTPPRSTARRSSWTRTSASS